MEFTVPYPSNLAENSQRISRQTNDDKQKHT